MDKYLINTAMFGRKLQTLRIKNNMRVEEIAEKCGKANGYIRTLESGVRLPSSKLLVKLCVCLKTTPNYLLGYHKEIHEEYEEILNRINQLTPEERKILNLLLDFFVDYKE